MSRLNRVGGVAISPPLSLAWLRWSGIAGIAGSVGYMIGDALLLGNSATVSEFPHLATCAMEPAALAAVIARPVIATVLGAVSFQRG